ncbi:MAG: TonB-dependent siderophore receptor [Chromatiales bacterium]|jgi:catecholate siderophore receptor|nr:TonB-dependent siderophore receptor [Chromatiales bacterium]
MPHFKRRPLVAAMLITVLPPCTNAFACDEEAIEHLPTIKVTATIDGYKIDEVSSSKFTQPLLDTTQTITVIPEELLQDQGAATLRDALRNTPGITFQAGEAGAVTGDQNFTMRGFSARNSLLIDGVRDTGTYARDVFNLEQVEVAKGPSAAVMGRSTTGGFVNQVSKMPTLESFNEASIGAGSANYVRTTADINRPIGDSMAMRLNLMYHDADVSGRDVVTNNRWGVAPSFAIGLGTPTRISANYMKMKQDNVPDYGLPANLDGIDLDGNNVTDDGNDGLALLKNKATRSNFYGLKNYDFEDIDTDASTVRIEHDFSNALRLQNVTRYIDTQRNSATTSPRPPNRQLQRREQGSEVIANQTSLTVSFDTAGLRHDLVTGVEISREQTSNRNSAQTDNQPPISNPLNPNPNHAPNGPMPAITGDPSKAQVDDLAIYVFDTIALSEAWLINGGVRADSYDVTYRQNDAITGASILDLKQSQDTLTWQAGIAYKPRTNGTIYLGFGTSVDPSFDAANAGPQLSADGTSANNTRLAPEKSRSLELGTKWEVLDNRLSLNAAIFRTEKTNARTRDSANNLPFVLDGKQIVDGVEIGISGNITQEWQVFAGAAWMDSDIKASALSSEVNNSLALTPETSYNLWTTYRLPFNLTIGGGVQYMDAVYRNTTNITRAPSYTVTSLMASYPVNDAITLRLNVDNVTDEAYVANVGGGHFIPGPGRSAFVTADLRF